MKTVTSALGIEAALGLANSTHGPGAHYRRRARRDEPAHDHLTSAADAIEFLGTHEVPTPDLPPTDDQLARLRAIRALARALAHGPAAAVESWRDRIAEALDGIAYRIGSDGRIRSAASGWDGVADDLLPAVLALAEQADRIRTCANPLCLWLFVDRSRNGSRVWCEMAVCGNRMRVNRHRLRRAALSRPGRPSGPRD